MPVGTPIYPDNTRDSGSTLKGRYDDVIGIHGRLSGPFAPYASLQFDFVPGDVSVANDTITRADHLLFENDVGRLTTTGTLPAGLSLATNYHVLSGGLTTDVFKVSLSQGGAVVDITDTGSGIHTFERTENLKVAIRKGFVLSGVTLTEVAAQQSSALTAPSANPRIDRVTISKSNGAMTVTTGAENASPVAPTIPSGNVPVCQIAWVVSQTEIVNADLTDERATPISSDLVDDLTPQQGGAIDSNAFSYHGSEGADVVAATQTNIWATDGDTIFITGNTTINDFTNAPRIGVWKMLIFTGIPQLTSGSGITVVGGTRTMAAGDYAFIYADAVDAFRALIFKADGTPVIATDINALTNATVTLTDKFMFADTGSGNVIREDDIQGIADLITAGFTLATEQSTTSGSSKTFGGIPAGTKMIVIMFKGVSFNAGVDLDVTIGDAGGLETSGYICTQGQLENAVTVGVSASTAEFFVGSSGVGVAWHGMMILTLENSSNFTWAAKYVIGASTIQILIGAGTKSLSAELTQVSISGGTFDAGAVNIMYQ